MKKLWILIGLLTVTTGFTEVKIEQVDGNNFCVKWDGKSVVLPSLPKLRQIGGGRRQVFDPTARVFREIVMTPSQSVLFKVVNKQGEQVFLGNGKLSVKKNSNALIYRQTFANAGAWWQVTLQTIDQNGFDVLVEAEVAPEYNLTAFDMKLMDLNLSKATADYGGLGQWRRNLPTSKGLYVGPVPGDIRINYPSNNLFVPAAVLQDEKFAMGICRLGVHNEWRTQFGELTISPKKETYELRISTGWAEAISTECLYQHKFRQQYRIRFSDKRSPGPAGYLQLVDAKDLWIDYMKEMDKYVPIQKNPKRDQAKNNILIMNFFMAENYYSTDRNPQGWTMNDPNWKTNKWEFPPEAAKASGAELKKLTGFSEDNFGRPVKWIKAFAEKQVREMKETKALANVVWRSSTWRGANNQSLDYLPDTHYFHPEMEERITVKGPVRNWDWVVADIELLSPDGRAIARKENQVIHAANLGKLKKITRYQDNRQTVSFKADNLLKDSSRYVKAAANIGAEEKLRDLIKLYIKVLDSQAKLVGKKAGDSVDLKALPLVHDRALAKPLTLKVKIKSVKRAAIDVWAKTMTDAGCEIGFLIREDFLMGPPWHQTYMRLDWTAEWQYNLFCQRVEWHQMRFGKKCRYFYLDVFANETPDFVLQRMRKDFPDCFFFAEHPNGVAIRTIQTWNWFNIFTALELYLNPNALGIILPGRILSMGYGGLEKANKQDLALVKKVWKNPNYVIATHRGARKLVKLAERAGAITKGKKGK